MATLKDVAREAGVSVATVSCCLSGAKPVKAETKERIMDAIERLKYIPNASARNLRTTDSRVIGVVLPNMRDHLMTEILDGISRTLNANGYELRLTFSEQLPENERRKLLRLISQNVDGLLILSCQPEQTDFFKNQILHYGVPVCFLERKPDGIEADFVGFSYKESAAWLTRCLREKGYEDIALCCGEKRFSSEKESRKGFLSVMGAEGKIYETDGTRENAFQIGIRQMTGPYPQAIISTSGELSLGLLAAFKFRGVKVPDDVLLISYGEESWSPTDLNPVLIQTSRQASYLGEQAARQLLWRITHMQEPGKELLLKDTAMQEMLNVPPMQKRHKPEKLLCKEQIRFLMVDIPTPGAIRELIPSFTRDTGIAIECEVLPQKEMLKGIMDSIEGKKQGADIFIYDSPWLPYLVQNGCLADLTEFVQSPDFQRGHIFRSHMENCRLEDAYYGVPIVGGTQFLFYRRDFFENRELIRLYQKQHQLPLRPPVTWREFNQVSAFFTKSINPAAPTVWGTSFAGLTDEELAPEILIRLWANGGHLWDAYSRPDFDCEKNVRVFENLQELLRYSPEDAFSHSIEDTVDLFLEGKTAMLLTYSEYAGQINREMKRMTGGQPGYALIPGRKPASVGWNVGVSPFTEQMREVSLFLEWLCRKDVSYYLTILSGQSPVSAPYRNHELQRLYPWLAMTEESVACSLKRIGPERKRTLIIPQNQIEEVLCRAFRQVAAGERSVKEALEEGQGRLEHLFTSYGYPLGRKYRKSDRR